MDEFENINELPSKDGQYDVISNAGNSDRSDPYTYYAGTPSEYRYVPEAKKKKRSPPGSWF